jgi:hypothetical protein
MKNKKKRLILVYDSLYNYKQKILKKEKEIKEKEYKINKYETKLKIDENILKNNFNAFNNYINYKTQNFINKFNNIKNYHEQKEDELNSRERKINEYEMIIKNFIIQKENQNKEEIFKKMNINIGKDAIEGGIKEKEKAKEIINEESDKPNYYKLGKFVNSYISYDISYSGKDLTVKEIYDGKKGVCEHYTKLYNAMLNAIGIKTLYISGWAFDGNQTSGNKDTSGHAWTAALIDDKWIELDATWGLFEGISAGHIMKFFDEDSYSYSCNERYDNQLSLTQDNNIKATSIEISESGSAGSTDGGKTPDNDEEAEEDDSDVITRIQTTDSSYVKSSLILLILFSLF